MGNQSTLSPSLPSSWIRYYRKKILWSSLKFALHTSFSSNICYFYFRKKISRKEGVSIVRACNKPHLIDDRLCKLVLASRRLLSKSLAQNISLLLLIVVLFFFGVAIPKESQQKFTIATQYLIYYFADELEAKKIVLFFFFLQKERNRVDRFSLFLIIIIRIIFIILSITVSVVYYVIHYCIKMQPATITALGFNLFVVICFVYRCVSKTFEQLEKIRLNKYHNRKKSKIFLSWLDLFFLVLDWLLRPREKTHRQQCNTAS